MALQVRPLFQAIVTRLTGDATLTSLAPGGVYRNAAPRTATYPYVVFLMQNAQISPTFDNPDGTEGGQTYAEVVIAMHVMDRSLSPEAASLAYAQAHSLLVPDAPLIAQVSTNGGILLGVVRESILSYDEDEDESKIQHEGGIYRMTLSKV